MYECMDDEYLKRINSVVPSKGIKICLGANEPLIGHSGVYFTPYAERINGINEVTQADHHLPPGKHLVMSHQAVLSDNLEEEIIWGFLTQEVIPEKKYEVLMVQSYSGGWPVNRASSGTDIDNMTRLTIFTS